MKCEQMHPLMMDFLYDEISVEDKKILQAHLVKCDKCSQELASLKSTSNILQKWEDIEPDFNLIMVDKKVNWWEKAKLRFREIFPRPIKIGYRFALGFVGLFLLLALANTRISYQQGNFNLTFGIFSRPSPVEEDDIYDARMKKLVESLRNENYYLMKSLIEQSEERQRKEWQASLIQFERNLEQQRINDFNLIGSGLLDIERNTSKKLQRTENSLNEMLKFISAPQK